jgi:hypothetical protein
MRILKRVSKYFLRAITVLIILLLGLYIFIQTETFNKWALDFTLDKLNKSMSEKDNHLYAESINGNILKGIRINNGAVTIRGDTLLSFKYIDLKYDVWGLLNQKIYLDYVVLNSPQINLVKIKGAGDSLVWNFSNLFTPSSDTTTSEFKWNVYVDKFRIENGSAKILDTLSLIPLYASNWETQKEFKLSELDLKNIETEINGEYSDKYKKLNIMYLSFNSNTDFVLKNFALQAFIDVKNNFTQITDLELITERTSVKIPHLKLSDYNPMVLTDFDSFKDKNIEVKIDIGKFNFADLRFLIPTIDMLDSSVSLSLDADGKFGDINVKNLYLKLPNSVIEIRGNVKNVNNPDSLYFDTYTDSKIYTGDIKTIYNSKTFPDFSRLGIINAKIFYKGGLNEFNSIFDVESSSGNVNGNVSMNFEKEYYDGKISADKLNLGNVLKNNALKSNLTFDADISGSGYSPRNMRTNVKYSLKKSYFAGYDIRGSSGTVDINRNIVGLKIQALSSAGNAKVTGEINIANMKNPVYSLRGTVNNFDASRLTKNSDDKSNINLKFDINGSGISVDKMNGKYNADIGNSSYSEYSIPQTNVKAIINAGKDNSSLNLNSEAFEFNAGGTFNIGSLVKAILYNISSVSDIVTIKLNSDTNIVFENTYPESDFGIVNINYKFITKDTAKLNKLTEPFGIIVNGSLSGNIKNSPESFDFVSISNIKNFSYKDTSIILKNFNSDIIFKNDYSGSNNPGLISSLSMDVSANAERIRNNSNNVDSVILKVIMDNGVADASAKGKMDSSKYAGVSGKFDLNGNAISASIDSVYARYNIYTLKNSDVWTINYFPGENIEIKKLGLQSGNMILNVDGIYSFIGNSNINLNAENMDIGEIYEMISPTDSNITGERVAYPVKGELANLSANIQGTPGNLNLDLEVKTGLLKYDSIGIGNIVGSIKYKDETLFPDIVITNNGNTGNIKITGSYPLANPFVAHDTLQNMNDKPADLKLVAANFQIQYFTKLIPGAGDLRGLLNGTLTAQGTIQNPDLKGDLTMVQGKYFLSLIGMYYDFKFKVSTSDSKLVIDNISIYNPDDDTKHIDFRGTIDFGGFKLNNIDLSSSGDMVILDKNSRENAFGITGSLLGGIGTPPITIKGNLEKLNIAGQFLIKSATITSLPVSGLGYKTPDKKVIYVNAKDTVNKLRRKYVQTLNEYEKINPFERDKYILMDTNNISVLEMLMINVNVKTEKNMYVSIDFHNLTRDRLYGEITADLNLRSSRGRLFARGELNVVGNSYYRFYRDFKVKDSKITFSGPIGSPELDIRAVYENRKTTEQFGTISNNPIQVILTAKGAPSDPEISLKLYENGTEMQGNDATADAITYLLFGKYKNELSASEQQSVATGIGSTVGSLYVSSFVGQIIRNIVPFINDAEINYSEGGIENTSGNVSANLYNADITVGSRVVNNSTYLEFGIGYDVKRIIKINVPETIMLQLSREQMSKNIITDTDIRYSTGVKLIYTIKY